MSSCVDFFIHYQLCPSWQTSVKFGSKRNAVYQMSFILLKIRWINNDDCAISWFDSTLKLDTAIHHE